MEKASEQFLTINNQPKTSTPWKIPAIIIGSIVIIAVLTGILISLSQGHIPSASSNYGTWDSTVSYSDDLRYYLEEEFESDALETVYSALDEYFISLYPEGIGLSIVTEKDEAPNSTIKIVSSQGKIHSFKYLLEDEKSRIYIGIDDTEKVYPIEDFVHENEEIE